MPAELPQWLKAAQAMALLGIQHRCTWRKLVDAGTVKPRRIKGLGRPVFIRDEILKLCK